jgi:hypothetical protein
MNRSPAFIATGLAVTPLLAPFDSGFCIAPTGRDGART